MYNLLILGLGYRISFPLFSFQSVVLCSHATLICWIMRGKAAHRHTEKMESIVEMCRFLRSPSL